MSLLQVFVLFQQFPDLLMVFSMGVFFHEFGWVWGIFSLERKELNRIIEA